MAHFHGNKKIFKRKEKKELHDPLEKYRLRVMIGRKTGRMDLSTKAQWVEKPPTPQASASASRSNSPTASRQGKRKTRSSHLSLSRSPSPSLSSSHGDLRGALEGKDQRGDDVAEGEKDRDREEGVEEGSRSPIPPLFANIAIKSRGQSRSTLLGDEEASVRSIQDDLSFHSGRSNLGSSGGGNASLKEAPLTQLPIEEEIEFRLNVIPMEIFKIIGKQLRTFSFFSSLKLNPILSSSFLSG